MAAQRDYYADLELPRDADISDVKKQFRKLALKYHPDRNPGREQEVNEKFQVIQAAHEVLSDPTEKAKYDATLGRSRYPGASGVRGNPWANAGSQFPTPPRRTNAGAARGAQNSKHAQSGAQRWQTRFSSGVPPTAKQAFGSDPEAKKNAAKAFENMRKNAQQGSRPTEPPPPPPRQPPRTESAKQRAEASFGSRKSGYYPRSTMPGDEPPVASSNYSNTERRDIPPPPPRRPGHDSMPDPLTQFRDKSNMSASPKPTSHVKHDAIPQTQSDEGQQQSSKEGTGAHTESSSKYQTDARPSAEHAKSHSTQTTSSSHAANPSTKENGSSIFDFPMDDDTFRESRTTSGGHGFAKSTVDDINTNFVHDTSGNSWKFNAGTGEADANVGNRPSPGDRRHRQFYNKRPTMYCNSSTNTPLNAIQAESGFNPEGWSNKFGPQTFIPQTVPGPSASPTRTSRSSLKKTKVKSPAGTTASVEESSSDEETYDWRGRSAQAQPQTRPVATDSPQAMDIDTPPSETPPVQPARNIHVEPSRPEWRAGNVDDGSSEQIPQRPAKIPLNANIVGSEDSVEFVASFADLKKVAPLSEKEEGLNSLNGLKDNLPFESKASDVPPIKLPALQPLAFPESPKAPHPPPSVAIEGIKPNASSWGKYLADFEDYLRHWDSFNSQVVDHFATRQAHISGMRATKGYGFLGTRGDMEIQEYYNWVQQDNDVRQQWIDACVEHQDRMREFMAFRDKMRRTG